MKKKICLLVMSIFLMTITPFVAGKSEAIEVSGSASLDIMSDYVWRGQDLSNGIAVQPSAGITYEGFGVNLWANYDAAAGEETETDLTLNYTFAVDNIGFDTGYIYYAFPGGSDTQELYLAVSYDTMLSPSLTIYYDFDEGSGAFAVVSIGHSIELMKGTAVDLGASASYNFSNEIMGFDSKGNDFNDFYNGELSASVTIPLNANISVAPMIAYSFPLSGDAEDAIEGVSDDMDEDHVYGGVNLTLSF